MRVGIDARLLSMPLTGIGRYTYELTSRLLEYPNEYFIYTNSDLTINPWVSNNVNYRTLNLSNRSSKMVWSQTVLPYWAKKDKIDVFWGPSHRIPQYLPNNIASVVTIHDLVWKYAGNTMRPLSRWMEKRLMPYAVRRADIVVADSHSTAGDILNEYPFADNKVRVIYPGTTILPTPQKRDTLLTLGIKAPYFLFVGTIEPRKNIIRLLNAYRTLNKKLKNNAKLVIVGGGGWGKINLNKIVDELELTNDVIITGYVDDKILSTLYSNALFLTMPSVYEGFGFPIVEAMSFGRAILTSNVSSMPEICGGNGILVDPYDLKSIEDGLSLLITNIELRNSLALRSKQYAQQYSWNFAARKMQTAFNDAFKARCACSRKMK